jgi:glutamine amidotransferase
MNVTIVDYNSGNISSVINSFKEVAKDKVNIEVTADLNKIKSADKVVLPGQGSLRVVLMHLIILMVWLKH